MLLEYSHTKSESLAQISTPMAEIHNFFMGLFFVGALSTRGAASRCPSALLYSCQPENLIYAP